MLAACSQMNSLIRWRRLNTECYGAFCPRQWCVCVSEIKQKGKTKGHQVRVYPSMVIFVCPVSWQKQSHSTQTCDFQCGGKCNKEGLLHKR